MLNSQIVQVLGCTSKSAAGYQRQFAVKKYDALGIIDRKTPGYRTAKASLHSVAPQAQLKRRSSTAVSDNLTIVAKYADQYMNAAAVGDVQRVQAQLADEPDENRKRRLMTNALNERITRLKRFNMWHVDPTMIGNTYAKTIVQDQANYYLNQAAEKNATIF